MTALPDQSYREIPLTKGLFAKVDACDYEELSKHNWYAQWSRNTNGYYAARHARKHEGIRRTILMHRQILGLEKGDRRQGEHALQNTLDNRRFLGDKPNLRIASHAQNQQNKGKTKANRTGFKGVSYITRDRAYIAQIRINGVQTHLGTRPTAKEAFEELYVPAAQKYHGEFARFE